ncbi:MAG: hypothetical protein AB7V26_03130 [Lysobacterales bacterium]
MADEGPGDFGIVGVLDFVWVSWTLFPGLSPLVFPKLKTHLPAHRVGTMVNNMQRALVLATLQPQPEDLAINELNDAVLDPSAVIGCGRTWRFVTEQVLGKHEQSDTSSIACCILRLLLCDNDARSFWAHLPG